MWSQPFKTISAECRECVLSLYGLVQGGCGKARWPTRTSRDPRGCLQKVRSFLFFSRVADLIRTYHQFRWKLNYRLRSGLRIQRRSLLFGMFGRSPEWLKSQFEDTGVRLRVGPWNLAVADKPGVLMQADEPDFIAAVWRRTADAGVVEPGPARATDDDSLTIMYGLAVKPLSNKP